MTVKAMALTDHSIRESASCPSKMKTSSLLLVLSRVSNTAKLITPTNSCKELLMPNKDRQFIMVISISTKKDTNTHMETHNIIKIVSKGKRIAKTMEITLISTASTVTPPETRAFFNK